MALSWNRTTVIHRRNRNFVGRDSLLESMHQKLCSTSGSTSGPAEPISCLLQGLGGIGKTQVALEYCYRHQKEYDWQFWVTAETSTKLLDTISSIADKMPREAKVTDDVVSDILTWLETTGDSWLMVFDNVEDWSSVYDIHAPRQCNGRSAVILTSQLTAIGSEVDHVFEIKSLSVEDGAMVLAKHVYGTSTTDRDEGEAAQEISRRFSGLPLALAHIGGFIKESGSSLAKYEKIFKDRYSASWHGKTHATRQYEKPMEVVWDFALSEDQLSTKARRLIQILAFLDPDGVPEDILLKNCREDPSWGFVSGAEEAEFLVMRRSLHKRSLVSIEAGSDDNSFFTIHRSLQHAILLQLDQDPSTQETIFHQAFQTIRSITPRPSAKQIPNPKLWPQFEIAIPHIVSLCSKFTKGVPQMSGTLEFAELLYDGGFFLWEREDPATEDAVLVLETALKILDEVGYQATGRLRADLLAILAMCGDRLGPAMYSEGLKRRKQARQIRQAIKGKEVNDDYVTDTTDRLLYNSLNDQGISEFQHNRFQEAERLFEECFKKYKTWGSEKDIPFEYAKYYHNLGMVRMCQGRFSDAILFSRRAVELEEMYEGERNSRVIWFDYDFACVILQAGDLKAALEKHLGILNERELQGGKYSEMTLQSYYTVGAMYHHLGELEEAERYIRECIDRASSLGRKRWPECALGRAHMHLSRLLKARGTNPELAKEHEDFARGILDKYRHISQSFTPNTDNDMDLFDSLQPVFDGRYTGRGLLPLLKGSAAAVEEANFTMERLGI